MASLPDSPGVEVARAKCIGCHEADLIVSQRLSPTGWDREVAKMERWGAKLSAEERPALVAYLDARSSACGPGLARRRRRWPRAKRSTSEACRVCHEDDLSEQQRLSAAAWGRDGGQDGALGSEGVGRRRSRRSSPISRSRWGYP